MEKSRKIRNAIRIKFKSNTSKVEARYELLKLPIEVLYKNALQEIGALEAYIEELNNTIKRLKEENKSLQQFKEALYASTKEVREAIRREDMYQQRLEECNRLKNELRSLYESRSSVIMKLVAVQNELEQIKNNKAQQ